MQAVQARTRITLKNILFATDFSAAADAALPIAIEVARRYGAKVYGVHVNRFDDYPATAPMPGQRWLRRRRKKPRKMLDA